MTRPADVPALGEELYEQLEPFAREDEDNDWALLVLCGALWIMNQDLADLISEDDDGNPGWSSILDIESCPEQYLPWLGQFVGTHVPDGLSETEARDLVRDHPSYRRGTPAAIEAAVAATLTGTQSVTLVERNEDPYALLVAVDASEMPDEDATLAAALSQKPAGIVLTLDSTEGVTIDELSGTIDSLSGTIDSL